MTAEPPVRPPPGSPDDPSQPRTLREAVSPRPAVPAASPPADVVFAEPGLRMTIVPLAHPVVIGGVRRDEIEVHRLVGSELYDLVMQDAEEAGLGRRVRARMTRLPVGAIDALDADDTKAVLDACEPFLPAVIRSLEGAAAVQDEASRAGVA